MLRRYNSVDDIDKDDNDTLWRFALVKEYATKYGGGELSDFFDGFEQSPDDGSAESRGLHELLARLERLRQFVLHLEPSEADVVVSTPFKAKGMEWNSVLVCETYDAADSTLFFTPAGTVPA